MCGERRREEGTKRRCRAIVDGGFNGRERREENEFTPRGIWARIWAKKLDLYFGPRLNDPWAWVITYLCSKIDKSSNINMVMTYLCSGI